MEWWKKAMENKNGSGYLEQKDSSSMTRLIWSGIPETQATCGVPPTRIESTRLTQVSEAPWITTAITEFILGLCKDNESPTTYEVRLCFQLSVVL